MAVLMMLEIFLIPKLWPILAVVNSHPVCSARITGYLLFWHGECSHTLPPWQTVKLCELLLMQYSRRAVCAWRTACTAQFCPHTQQQWANIQFNSEPFYQTPLLFPFDSIRETFYVGFLQSWNRLNKLWASDTSSNCLPPSCRFLLI